MGRTLDSVSLVVQLYHSENALGYNAKVQIFKEVQSRRELAGVMYISFDHQFPKFLWETNNLTPGEREYIELRAQMEVEGEIRSLPSQG